MPTIKGKQTQSVEIDVSEREFAKLMVAQLHRIMGVSVPSEYGRHWYFIKDGWIWEEYEEGGGSHSWFTKEKVREATPLDVAIFEVIKAIHTYAEEKSK